MPAKRTLISASILSRLDYRNAMLSGVPYAKSSKQASESSKTQFSARLTVKASKLPSQTIIYYYSHFGLTPLAANGSQNTRQNILFLLQFFVRLILVLNICSSSMLFTSTETVRTVRNGEPRTASSTFTQLLSFKTNDLSKVLQIYTPSSRDCDNSSSSTK